MNHHICVIIPAINFNDDFERCISSILSQIMLPQEIVIAIDRRVDESENDYVDKFNKFRNYFLYLNVSSSLNIKLTSTSRNLGPGGARRLAQKNCSDHITSFAFLDSDDYWAESHLSSFVQWYERNKIEGKFIYFDMYNSVVMPYRRLSERKMLFSPRLHTPSAIISRSDILFNSGEYAEDFTYWSVLIDNGFQGYCVNEEGSFGRANRFGGGQSQNLVKMALSSSKFIIRFYFKKYPFCSLCSILITLLKFPVRMLKKALN